MLEIESEEKEMPSLDELMSRFEKKMLEIDENEENKMSMKEELMLRFEKEILEIDENEEK